MSAAATTIIENRLVIGAADEYERQHPEYTADEKSAQANRYELVIDRLNNGSPREVLLQLMDTLQGCDDTIERAMAAAIRRRDYAELGRVLFAELEKFRHLTAQAEVEQ